MDIKENLARNLCALRKSHNLTQLELADKLNYSDKAVSKWERGEAVPDLYVIKQLADLYSVTIDTLIKEPKPEKTVSLRNIPIKRRIIALSGIVIVWLAAILLYFFSSTIFPTTKVNWLLFIYAVPITQIVLLSMSSYWGRNKYNLLSASLLTWTALFAVFISLKILLISPPENLWLMFLVGFPIQILLVLYFLYKKVK